MTYLVDSSVFVAASVEAHPHHSDSFPLIEKATVESACASVHSLAEIFSSMTKLPLSPRPAPNQAMQFIRTIKHKFRWIALTDAEYLAAIEHCVVRQVSGGKIYDALIFAAAKKAGVEILYTWNIKDFKLLAEHSSITLNTPDLFHDHSRD